MEYAGSYALFNYRLEDPKRGLEYDNLRLIRAFEHGLNPKSSEAGFVLVHVDMVQNSGPLVDGVVSALDACESNDREAFNIGTEKVVNAMTKVNKVMDGEYIHLLRLFQSYKTPEIDSSEVCGERVSQETTLPSEHSSLASPANPCFQMA